jgi:Kef-type K+ transport system membrane component KefB
MEHGLLVDIGIAVVVATGFGIVARLLKQPLLLGYIAAGILVGPTEGFAWITPEGIESISELGLILLLFMVGLEIDLKKLRESGASVATAGIGQFVLCVALGLAAAPVVAPHLTDGYGALYLAVSCALSSTMIVVKLLHDRSELDTLPGRLTLGILVFQDIWAILFLAVQPELADPSVTVLAVQVVKGIGLITAALLLSRYLLPAVFRTMSAQPELLVLGALGWCFALVLGASGLGLSMEIGALVAGIALSTFPYSLDVTSKVISLRDFFITLFFVALGTQVTRPDLSTLGIAALLTAFVVVSRLMTITPLLLWRGMGVRASVVPAINLAQVSEFSLVIVTLGVELGHVGPALLSTIVWSLTLSAVLSSYLITNAHAIQLRLGGVLARFGVREVAHADDAAEAMGREIMFLGFHRQSSSLVHELLAADPSLRDRIAVIDFNPETRDALAANGITTIYGDIGQMDLLHHAGIEAAEVVISSVPDSVLVGVTNQRLLQAVRSINRHARVITIAETFATFRQHDAAGAAFVFLPRLMGVDHVVRVVRDALTGDVAAARQAIRELVTGRREVLG